MADMLATINRAASATGNARLATLDDDGDVAQLVTEHYEAQVGDLLTQPGWKFAKRTATLELLADVPVPPWGAIYAAPTDMLCLTAVQTSCGRNLEHEECSASSGRGIAILGYNPPGGAMLFPGTLVAVARYVYRVPESQWPADFDMAVQLRMESIFLSAIAEQRKEASTREQRADMKEAKARVRDKNSSTPSDPAEWDLTQSRHRNRAWSAWRERGGY